MRTARASSRILRMRGSGRRDCALLGTGRRPAEGARHRNLPQSAIVAAFAAENRLARRYNLANDKDQANAALPAS